MPRQKQKRKKKKSQRPDEVVPAATNEAPPPKHPLTAEPPPSAGRPSWADDMGTLSPCPNQSTLAWDIALAALLGTDSREYEIRPVVVPDSTARQFFVERPPRRRAYGGDKWRFSGGRVGGAHHAYHDDLGVCKRYGMLIRGGENTGREPLKFMCFSLLRRASTDAEWHEQRDVVLYVVAGVTDRPPGYVAPEAAQVAARPASAQVNSVSWFGGWGKRPAAVETMDVGASGGFFADVLRSMPWRQPEESAPKASTEDSPRAQQRRRYLEPTRTIDAARPWPATWSGGYAAPDPELDNDWESWDTDHTDSHSSEVDPFAEFDLWSHSPSISADEDEEYHWCTLETMGSQDVGASNNPLEGIEIIWAREALKAEAAKEPAVDRAEVDELAHSVADLMRNLSINVEASGDPFRMHLAGPSSSTSASGTLDPHEERGQGKALPKLSALTGRSKLPAGNAVRKCLELHAAMRFRDPAAAQAEEARPEWAAACLTTRGDNVEHAAKLLGKYMQWRDKYGIASEGQPSSQRMQVSLGHVPTGCTWHRVDAAAMPLHSHPLFDGFCGEASLTVWVRSSRRSCKLGPTTVPSPINAHAADEDISPHTT